MKHGAGAPQVKAAARRRLQLAALKGDMGELLEELEFDAGTRHPVEALLDVVHRTDAMVQVLGALVGGLSADVNAKVDGIGAKAMGARLWGVDHLGDGAQHVLVEMYGEWLQRAARASKLALDAGIDERRVRVEERQAEMLGVAVDRTMLDLFRIMRRVLGPEHRAEAAQLEARLEGEWKQLLAGHLRAIEVESVVAADRADGLIR